MRLLICNWTRRSVAGIEDYLSALLPGIAKAGFDLAFVSEVDSQTQRAPIELPAGTPEWCSAQIGRASTLKEVARWQPDLIYCHGPLSAPFESKLLEIAPGIYFAHNYYGTCISGHKAHRLPTPHPCQRKLGITCLAHYLPRRCGGRSPITMLRLYWRERKRLKRLGRYRAIVTHSSYMRTEYIKHGIPAGRLFNFVYEVKQQNAALETIPTLVNISSSGFPGRPQNATAKQILFLGRMESLKGGPVLIAAASLVQKQLRSPIHVVFGGDGPDREHWRRLSEQATACCPLLRFDFPGWLSQSQVANEFAKSDVLAVPSLWPEPFGRVGVQAGHHAVPVAAFAVGGIPEWLENGVNGYLAPADPPTAQGLATALLQCLDETLAPGLRDAARRLADKFSTRSHLEHLLGVFDHVLASSSPH